MLVSQEPVRRNVPHEPGEYFEFIRQSDAQLREARRRRETEQMEIIRALGGEIFEAMQKGDRQGEERLRQRLRELRYDVSQYHIPTLLASGIAGWSYKEPPGEDPSEQIDPRTAEWAGQMILDLSRPPNEEEQGEASGDSSSI